MQEADNEFYDGPFQEFERVYMRDIGQGSAELIADGIDSLADGLTSLPPSDIRAIFLNDDDGESTHVSVLYWPLDDGEVAEHKNIPSANEVIADVNVGQAYTVLSLECHTNRANGNVTAMLRTAATHIRNLNVARLDAITFSNIPGEDWLESVVLTVLLRNNM